MAEIPRRQAEVQKMQAKGLALYEHDKLNGLIGFMSGYFRKE